LVSDRQLHFDSCIYIFERFSVAWIGAALVYSFVAKHAPQMILWPRGLLISSKPTAVGGACADVVRGAFEASRLEACESAGVRLGGGGDAV
jgi:hypothetical protein